MDTSDERVSKGDATRALILDTAMTMFGERGYHGTSVRDIAARCDMTHPGLLYHFPTKQALLMAVLTRRDEVDAIEFPTKGQSGLATLRSLAGTARANESKRGLVELFATLSAEATDADHPAHAFFVERYRSLLADIEAAFEEVRRAGELRPGVEPALAARHVVALMDGLQVQWLLDEATPMGGAVTAYLETVLLTPLRGVAAEAG